MNHGKPFGVSTTLLLAAFCNNCSPAAAQDELSMLLNRLKTGPLDQATLYGLEGRPPDPQTIPALQEAFERNNRKRDKQLIAVTLIHLGEQSRVYFDFLAYHAKEAIEDPSPSFLKYDAAGKAVKGQYAPAFENWCAQNGKIPKSMGEFQFDSAMDVLMLARAQDRRAEELLVRGLDSPHEFVIMYSVEGLGRLQAASAIPKIARLCDQLPAEVAAGVGMQLAWFSDLRAFQLMQRVVPDERLRNSFREGIARQRNGEIERAFRRNGGSAPAQKK
jgi:hypothetical protein